MLVFPHASLLRPFVVLGGEEGKKEEASVFDNLMDKVRNKGIAGATDTLDITTCFVPS